MDLRPSGCACTQLEPREEGELMVSAAQASTSPGPGQLTARRVPPLLTKHRKELEALAGALLERETLDEEVLEVTGLPPAPPLENRKVSIPDADSRAWARASG